MSSPTSEEMADCQMASAFEASANYEMWRRSLLRATFPATRLPQSTGQEFLEQVLATATHAPLTFVQLTLALLKCLAFVLEGHIYYEAVCQVTEKH